MAGARRGGHEQGSAPLRTEEIYGHRGQAVRWSGGNGGSGGNDGRVRNDIQNVRDYDRCKANLWLLLLLLLHALQYHFKHSILLFNVVVIGRRGLRVGLVSVRHGRVVRRRLLQPRTNEEGPRAVAARMGLGSE